MSCIHRAYVTSGSHNRVMGSWLHNYNFLEGESRQKVKILNSGFETENIDTFFLLYYHQVATTFLVASETRSLVGQVLYLDQTLIEPACTQS